ncbi:MAG: hypothetical protein BGN95_16790 [Sphingomonas sp. 66-10]|uniref:nuclear transport factor 2 family protein n=1 Tax=Sphingomonas sp. 66-10 TaxID=1895848 RepID=UPI00092A4D7C|nr:nuclear transport factor 2 family protein [Sphingomonas sp. 66-10]OJU17910.1 MAG: hypothetical protein BGN95_16790 [Sphingomonas sp. 66-10]
MTTEQRHAIEWECARLINLYATPTDAAQWEEVAALYTEDGVMTRPSAPDAPIAGRAAILAAFRARPPRTTRHITGNIVVTVEDEANAAATSAMLLFTAAASPPLVGGFRDRFRLVPGVGWRFAARHGWLDFA